MSGAISDLETHVQDGKPLMPDAARPPSGIAAPIWSTASDIARVPQPRNFLAELSQHSASPVAKSGRRGWVPNITQKGLSEWSDKDIAYFLETGQTPDGDSAGGAMVR